MKTVTLPQFLFADYHNKLYQKKHYIKGAASPRREGLVEFGVALEHVTDYGNKTLLRCRAENTKRFWLASPSRSSF